MKSKFYILLSMLLACTLQVKGADSYVVVGTKSGSARYVGFADDYTNFASQTLYRPTDIGKSGFITGFAYQVVTASSSTVSGSLKIYMALTDQNTLTPSTKLSKADFKLVYSNSSATLGMTSAGWKEFILQTPFYYDNSKKLVVAISVEKANTIFSTYAYYNNSAKDQYIRIANSSDIEASTLHDNEFVPVTRFKFSEASVSSTVGSGTTTKQSKTGFGDYWLNHASQTLYTSEEIGQSGAITSIAFSAGNTSSNTTGTLSVYMAEVDDNTLTTKLPSSLFKRVYYSSSYTFGKVSDGWKSVTLQTPFNYSGTKNLVVAIMSDKDDNSINVQYNCISKSGRCLSSTNDGANTSDNVNPFSSTLSAFDYVPVTRFTFEVSSECNNAYLIRGTGTASSPSSGFGAYFKYYSAQYLYPASELRMGYYITALGFNVVKTSSSTSSFVRVYLAETDQEELNTIYPISQMTCVYSEKMTLGSQTGYEMVTFKQPFLYTGRKNLVIAISSTDKEQKAEVYYECTNNISNRSVCWRSDDNAAYDNFNQEKSPNYTPEIPNVKFLVKYHSYSDYTPEGLGICRKCRQVLPYAYETPTLLASNTYGVSKVNHLNYIARQVAWGYLNSNHKIYIQNDLDLKGKDRTTIGSNINPFVSKLYGYNYLDKTGHTIRGIGSDEYLIGTLGTNGLIQSVRLESGKLVKTGTSGKIASCLTLGDVLVGFRTGTVIDSSFYQSNTANAKGGRTLEQMKSGEVTYGLNHAATSGGAKYYQTIGSDNYPVFDSSRSPVSRYTKCERYYYSNSSSDDGKVINHSWVNSVCANCSKQPTSFSEDVALSYMKPYVRTVSAQVGSDFTLTYNHAIGVSNANKWLPLYAPISFKVDESKYDLAEIQGFGVIEDTNEDGMVNTQDEKKLIVNYLEDGETTTPNTPYLLRARSGAAITFTSVDGKLYPNTVNEQTFSTMKDQIVITPVYNATTYTSGDQKQLTSGALKSSSSALSPFRWYATPSYKNGKTWDQSTINIFSHYFGVTTLVDDEKTSYTRKFEDMVDNLRYTRDFAAKQAHNWQSMYVPFDVVVEREDGCDYPKYATFGDIVTEGDKEIINLNILQVGDVIKANTPFLICEDEATTLTYDYSVVKLKSATVGQPLSRESSKATYTITGVYEPYSSASSWYGIAKSDGMFHPAGSGAVLPPYRFYMTIATKSGSDAAQLRFEFRERSDFETAIDTVGDDIDTDATYSLDGRKVQEESMQPGIYVRNGKKVSVR